MHSSNVRNLWTKQLRWQHRISSFRVRNLDTGQRLLYTGRSWSRAGAEAMCLVRCALATGRALLAPDKGALFTQKEQQAAFADTVRSARGVQARVGRGYLPPHQAATGSLKTAAGFRARSC